MMFSEMLKHTSQPGEYSTCDTTINQKFLLLRFQRNGFAQLGVFAN